MSKQKRKREKENKVYNTFESYKLKGEIQEQAKNMASNGDDQQLQQEASSNGSTSSRDESTLKLNDNVIIIGSKSSPIDNIDDDDQEDDNDVYLEAIENDDQTSSTTASSDESFHDLEPVEFLARLVTSETTRVLNEEIAGFQRFIEQRRQLASEKTNKQTNILQQN